MEAPGFTIFQGGESIHLNNSVNRAEEEEALEDQKRRQEELNHDLQNAFDDLIDDDDNTVDSSNFQSDNFPPSYMKHFVANGNLQSEMKHPVGRNPPNYPSDNIHMYTEEIQKLKMLLDSKTREFESVSKIAHEEKKKREETEKRLVMAEAECERAILSKKSTHELLVESKEKCSNLENVIQKLKTEIKSMEANNNDLIGKLETSQALLADVQHKYHMVERNMKTNNDRNAELKYKHADERHRAEVEMMQQQLDSMNNKLDKKTGELENMKTRYAALQHSHETMLIDKSSKINELSKSLAEAQKQCQELMCKHDYSQENIRLQRLVAELQLQIQNMEKTISSLKSRLEQTTADLDAMDTVLQQNNDESLRRLSQTQGNVLESTPLSAVDRASHLKSELYRAISNLRNKREDIRTLQHTLELKNQEIKNLKDEENRALVEITTCKEDNGRLKSKLKLLEEELNDLKVKHSGRDDKAKHKELLEEILHLKEEKQMLQSTVEGMKKIQHTAQELEQEKDQLSKDLRLLDSKLKNLQIDLEEVKQERDSLRQNYEDLLQEGEEHQTTQLENEKLKFLLKDSQKECDRLKNLYVEISNEKEALALELKNLRKSDFWKELQENKEKIANLNRALQLAEVKCSELTKILDTQRSSHEKDLAQLREKYEREKGDSYSSGSKNSSSSCSKCIEYITEATKMEIQILKLTNQCSLYQKEVDVLSAELEEAKQLVSDLSSKIDLIDEREKLIVELKAKAQQFEEYIKSQSSSGASSLKLKSSSSKTKSEDKSVETSPEVDAKINRRQIENRIRDEMAKIFANEIKNNEQRYRVKLNQAEEEIADHQRELQKYKIELSQREHEVQLLKHAILSEREKADESMKNKDKEFNEVFQKQNVILHKCRDELKLKSQRVNELLREMDARNAQIEAERESMKTLMTQWEEQRRQSDQIKEDWEEKIKDLKNEHENEISSWKSKYNSAKKTAVNYKRYAEDKENHMIQEYNRIKSEYDESLEKIKSRMKDLFEKKNREAAVATSSKDAESRDTIPNH